MSLGDRSLYIIPPEGQYIQNHSIKFGPKQIDADFLIRGMRRESMLGFIRLSYTCSICLRRDECENVAHTYTHVHTRAHTGTALHTDIALINDILTLLFLVGIMNVYYVLSHTAF